MLLVDTTVWIEAFSDRGSSAKTVLEKAISDNQVVVGDLILVELLQGVKPGPKLRLVTAAMNSFPIVTLCGPDIATIAASNYRALRAVGITVRGTIDVIIATWCVQNRVPLLHNDRDFDVMVQRLGLVAWR
jgi:predicted nucleic acid-binding protein